MLPAIAPAFGSLYNAEGDVLWLSEGALGPDEHSVVLDAMQTLQADIGKGYHETGLDDGRFGMFLPVRAPRGDLVGIVMLLTELKTLPEGIAEQFDVRKGPKCPAEDRRISAGGQHSRGRHDNCFGLPCQSFVPGRDSS